MKNNEKEKLKMSTEHLSFVYTTIQIQDNHFFVNLKLGNKILSIHMLRLSNEVHNLYISCYLILTKNSN